MSVVSVFGMRCCSSAVRRASRCEGEAVRGGRVASWIVERNKCISVSKVCREERGDAVVMVCESE